MGVERREIGDVRIDTGLVRQRYIAIQIELVKIVIGVLSAKACGPLNRALQLLVRDSSPPAPGTATGYNKSTS